MADTTRQREAHPTIVDTATRVSIQAPDQAPPNQRESPGSRHRSLRNEVVAELREQIIDGTLQPGERLIERDLASRYDVSRVPLREALLELEGEGFVRLEPRRGAVVESFSVRDVIDLMELRESLEPLAAQLAAERADSAGLARLKRLLDDAHAATDSGRQDLITQANAAFHEEIVALADNRLLTSMMRPLAGRTRWLFSLMSDIGPEVLCHEHETLYEVIASGDGPRAALYAREHVAGTREPTLRALEELQGGLANATRSQER